LSLMGKGWPARSKTPYRNGIRVQAIAVSGTTILAGTSSMGILTSKDGGLSWAEANAGLPKNANIGALALSGADIYAGLWDQSVFASRDGGSSWTAAGTGLPSVLWATCLAAVDSRLFVGTYNRGIFVSSDGGASWTETNTGVPGPAGLPQIKSLAAIGREVFALIYGLGVYRFHENDRSWTPVNPAATAGASVLAAVPGGSDLFIAVGSKRVLVSKDKGASWKETAPGLAAENPVDFLATDGSAVVAGTLTEAWRLSLAGANAAGKPAPAGEKPAHESADLQTFMTNGDRAQQAKDYANAIIYYGKAIEIDPGSTNALFQRAWSYLKLGADGYAKGLADLAKIQSFDPANTTIYYARGEIYRGKAALSQKDKKAKEADDYLVKALADFQAALKADPNSPIIPLSIGQAHLARGDLDQAMTAYAGLYDKKPHDTEIEGALKSLFAEYIRQNRDIDCGSSSRTWHLAGQFYYDVKRDDQAVRCFSRALDLGLTDNLAFFFRSRAYARMGDFDRAIADADRDIERNHFVVSYENRAEIYVGRGDHDKAIADLSQAIRLQRKVLKGSPWDYNFEEFEKLYWRRGDIYFAKKDWNKAIGDYKFVDENLRPGLFKQAVNLQIAEAYKNKGDAKNAQKYSDLAKTVGRPKK
jgi:tetratricopeptide (TPR) repeat protein